METGGRTAEAPAGMSLSFGAESEDRFHRAGIFSGEKTGERKRKGRKRMDLRNENAGFLLFLFGSLSDATLYG